MVPAHSQVDSEQTVTIIMAGCTAHAQTSPLLNLTSPSCSSTVIS